MVIEHYPIATASGNISMIFLYIFVANYCLLSSLGILSQVSITKRCFPLLIGYHLLQEPDTGKLRKNSRFSLQQQNKDYSLAAPCEGKLEKNIPIGYRALNLSQQMSMYTSWVK
jgi:hypothetical protein